jgi:hypothetical protein
LHQNYNPHSPAGLPNPGREALESKSHSPFSNEKQVNEILDGYHEDTATLRRELVGYGLMKCEGGGIYWREP